MRPSISTRRLIIVDDDLLSREVLALFAAEAGFEVQIFECGEQALEALALPGISPPAAILADMQMPGICGDSLGRLLRLGTGPATTLLAMSGTAAPPDHTRAFDAFLLKPFSIDDLTAAIDHHAIQASAHVSAQPYASGVMLNQTIYSSIAQSMSSTQLRQLYTLCLDDADTRLGSLCTAFAAGDFDVCRRIAHAIKGGCSMVGALELARLAEEMEQHGVQITENSDPLREFAAASVRLRHMLDTQVTFVAADTSDCGD